MAGGVGEAVVVSYVQSTVGTIADCTDIVGDVIVEYGPAGYRCVSSFEKNLNDISDHSLCTIIAETLIGRDINLKRRLVSSYNSKCKSSP